MTDTETDCSFDSRILSVIGPGAGVSAFSCRRNTPDYIERARPVIRTRLAQAGARLAWLMNETFLRENH